MVRETVLAGAAALVLAASVGAAGLAPGVLADPSGDEPAGRLSIAETTLSAGAVTGETATLQVHTALAHRGGSAENVTVVYRAIDDETELLAATARRPLGTVSRPGEVATTGNLTVDREGGYRIETRVYQDGHRVDGGRTTVSGVGSLEPPYARSAARFHRFEALPSLSPLQYTVRDVQDGAVTLAVSSYVTNTGDDPTPDVRVVVQARQSDANVIADRGEVTVGGIAPGRTATPSTTLTVPDEYNYYLDAFLYRDGVIVGTAQSVANLRPTEVITPNRTRREIGLRVEDFERDRDAGERAPGTRTADTTGSGPGFGVLTGIAAIVVLVLTGITRRWSP